MKTTNAIVRSALAHHLELDPSTIEAWYHLELDLYMSPGDLLLVIRGLEEGEDIALSMEPLTATATVGDLQALVARAIARTRRVHPVEQLA